MGQASRLIDISADPPIGATSTWIRERTLQDERIWVPDNQFARIYGESQRLSASRYIFAAPHLFIDAGESSREDRVATLLGDLHRAAPRFVVVHAESHERRVVKEARAWIESACAPVLTTAERLTVLECNPGAQ